MAKRPKFKCRGCLRSFSKGKHDFLGCWSNTYQVRCVWDLGGPLNPAYFREAEDCIYTYFIQCGPLVKIGVSKDMLLRMQHIPCVDFEDFSRPEMVAVISHSPLINLEKMLHRKLASFRERGEWFRLTRKQAAVLCAGIDGIAHSNGLLTDRELIRAA